MRQPKTNPAQRAAGRAQNCHRLAAFDNSEIAKALQKIQTFRFALLARTAAIAFALSKKRVSGHER